MSRDKLVTWGSSGSGIDLVTEAIAEGSETVEVTEKGSIITFHDNGSGEDQRESNCFWVETETLADGHVMLTLSSIPGIIVLVGQVRVDDRHLADVVISNTENIIAARLDWDNGRLATVTHCGGCRGVL